MAQPITAQNLLDEVQSVLPDESVATFSDFAVLANRAVGRLVTMANAPLLTREKEYTVESDSEFDLSVRMIPSSTEHILAFRKDNRVYNIAHVSDVYQRGGVSSDCFIDRGTFTENDPIYRYFTPPVSSGLEVGDIISGLIKKSYTPVASASDIFPYDSVGAPKNAMLAVHFEDQGDPSTAATYWQLAVRETQNENSEYRGASYPKFSFYDPVATEANRSIY